MMMMTVGRTQQCDETVLLRLAERLFEGHVPRVQCVNLVQTFECPVAHTAYSLVSLTQTTRVHFHMYFYTNYL